MDNSRFKFRVQNDINAGIISHSQLQEELKNWIREHSSFSNLRIRQIWAATWEAIQNSIFHGSESGETIEIIVSYIKQNELIKVAVKQPKIWETWEDNLTNKKQRLKTDELLMGGTRIMLQLADYIDILDSGRTIEMQFFPQVMSQRTLALTSLVS